MSEKETLELYRKTGALLEGHFILSSGMHSKYYLQSAIVLSNPQYMRKLAISLAKKIKNCIDISKINKLVSPAIGGIVIGAALGEELNINTIFTERVNGEFVIKRGFEIYKNDKILVVEDVITTGKSSKECFSCIENSGGKVIAEACLIDRSSGDLDLGVPMISLASIDVPLYSESNIPEDMATIKPIRPGSRKN